MSKRKPSEAKRRNPVDDYYSLIDARGREIVEEINAMLPKSQAVDENIARVVGVLNMFPGIDSISCCGGHAPLTEYGLPEGEFYICFNVDLHRGGWHSLELFSFAINITKSWEHVRLTVTNLGDCPGAMAFSLDGKNNADRDALAEDLMEMLLRVDDSDDDFEADFSPKNGDHRKNGD